MAAGGIDPLALSACSGGGLGASEFELVAERTMDEKVKVSSFDDVARVVRSEVANAPEDAARSLVTLAVGADPVLAIVVVIAGGRASSESLGTVFAVAASAASLVMTPHPRETPCALNLPKLAR